MSPLRVVLASTSRYRAELLRRLLATFEQVDPNVEEPELPGEAPAARAERLAVAKATAAVHGFADALVIGSDQVAALGNRVLHKPGRIEIAREQLHASSGNMVDFYTSICVIDSRNQRQRVATDHTRVVFRPLADAEIERYLLQEQPFDCAGSFKSEGAGIALFERVESTDPTALIGLPLVALARMLRQAGMAVP